MQPWVHVMEWMSLRCPMMWKERLSIDVASCAPAWSNRRCSERTISFVNGWFPWSMMGCWLEYEAFEFCFLPPTRSSMEESTKGWRGSKQLDYPCCSWELWSPLRSDLVEPLEASIFQQTLTPQLEGKRICGSDSSWGHDSCMQNEWSKRWYAWVLCSWSTFQQPIQMSQGQQKWLHKSFLHLCSLCVRVGMESFSLMVVLQGLLKRQKSSISLWAWFA